MKWFWPVLRVMRFRVTLGRGFRAEDALIAFSSGIPGRFIRRPALSFALLAGILGVAGCNDYGNTFQNPTGASIAFLAPSTTSAGGPAFTLTVSSPSGGFVTQTVVQWNGKTIPTTYVSASTVTAAITTAMIAKPGTVFVNTLNPFSGAGNNGLSNVLTFVVNPAAESSSGDHFDLAEYRRGRQRVVYPHRQRQQFPADLRSVGWFASSLESGAHAIDASDRQRSTLRRFRPPSIPACL